MMLRAGAVLLACLSPRLLELCFQKTFKVHSSGSILITGASTGIGKHACLELAKAHPELVLHCGVRKEKDGETLISEAQGAANLRYIILDTTKDDQILAAAEKLKGERLIGLVNNAGVLTRFEALEFANLDEFRWLFDVNFFGVLRLTQVLLPQLRENQGRVVVTSSVAGVLPGYPTNGAYSASKHAINAAFDSVRQEMEPHGVSVSLLCPAWVKSEIVKSKETRAAGQEAYTAEHKTLYPEVTALVKKSERGEAMADEPTVTTEAIDHALTSAHPKTHYMVANFEGVPAWLALRIFWLLPTRAADFVAML